MKNTKAPQLETSQTIREIPLACANEIAAVEFLEAQRWNGCPCCVHCGSQNVYKMVDDKTGERNKRFLWRCRDCKEQYTVRIGTVYEESRIPLRHWCYAFWRASTSKKGVSALEIKRHCQISYKSALFLMHRIRYALTPDRKPRKKLECIVEADETYVGGKPRPGTGPHKAGRGTSKTPVFAMVERGGNIQRRVVANVSGRTLKAALRECVDKEAKVITDDFASYSGVGKMFRGRHDVVCHSRGEYVLRGNPHINTNTVESSFAILKRGITGIFHAVSKRHLHRYVGEFDFRWNTRRLNDGDRTIAAIRSAEGKRLMYRYVEP
ncbi:MAG TPA: IS1595 family transposase [Verrucomicrobiae bacterium]|nr:IS1595 family transposase [Verrucomicrobiae bacterium]